MNEKPVIEQMAEPRATRVPKRFEPARSTLVVDRFMTRFIKVGGISIITVVLGIFLFILWQVIPLFRGARVTEVSVTPVEPGTFRLLALDEYAELPLLLDDEGRMTFVDVTGQRGAFPFDLGCHATNTFTAFSYDPARQEIVYGTADGKFSVVTINYRAEFADGKRRVDAAPRAGAFNPIGRPGFPIRQISYGDNGEFKVGAALQDVDGRTEVHVATLVQENTLFGSGEVRIDKAFDLSAHIDGRPAFLRVNRHADAVVVATDAGEVFYFARTQDAFQLRQKFVPFHDLPERAIASMDYLFGGVTLVFTSPQGVNRLFSLYAPARGTERLFGKTRQFDALEGGASFYSASLRNKAFLIGSGKRASLRFGTTERVRWQDEFPYRIELGALNGKYDRMVFLDAASQLHLLALDDPHPEASFGALFGKVWYEGSDGPRYEWQSTGGSDDFEPKLSLIPLIAGTTKGTLYAMMLAVPIALLAAVYTSQFAHPRFRAFFKPIMEIMASLPSVVLGFLAALWLAPMIETRVPSILLMMIVLPVGAAAFGWIWSSLPVRYRAWIRPGFELMVFIPLFLAGVWVCWVSGPVLERLVFVVADPATGERVADFRLWWPHVTGASFQQRNSLVVGFVMGFAVIPIIFTIAEDALSNVPATLRSGSLALGASRWQTAMRIILPTASAGIFSAIMVGLGRGVGETMIVVMATGNTPIMDLNIFSGMRTLSANIAVELPEAPYLGTLYRTLFLGAMVLFLLTFALNTLAEILRQRLRERYKLA